MFTHSATRTNSRILPFILTLSVFGCLGACEGDSEVVDSGLDGTDFTVEMGGAGGSDVEAENDTGMDDAPCAPNCPDLDWVTIQGGTFMMGSAEGIGTDDEYPQHEVTVKTFRMSKKRFGPHQLLEYLSELELFDFGRPY